LPARKLVRKGTEPLLGIADADLGEQLDDPGAGRATGDALMEGEAFADLPLDRVERVERGHRLLEDEADVVAARLAQPALVGAEHLGAAVADASRRLRVVGE